VKTLIQIQHQLQTGSFEFTRHAFKRAVERNISDSEMFQIDDRFQLGENIPATVCSNCGEAVFSRATTEHIRSMLYSNSQPIETISMDVYAY
jgi:HTH-type transcriptional regulator / antitoxin MqsA